MGTSLQENKLRMMELGKREGGRGQKLYHYGGTETFGKATTLSHWPTKRLKLTGKLKNILPQKSTTTSWWLKKLIITVAYN